MLDSQRLLDRVVKANDLRGAVPDELDEALAHDVGAALVQVLDDAGERPRLVMVGYDMRPSSPGLAAALAAGVAAAGADVIDIGLASTDLLYFASGSRNVPAAMITASHNPARFNGIKLCRAGAAPMGRDSGLRELRDVLQTRLEARLHPADRPRAPDELAARRPGAGRGGQVFHADLLSEYAAYLHSLVDLSGLRPLRVVVDAGNGMAGLTVPAVLGPQSPARDAVRVTALYFELDGTFPHHEANPLDESTLVAVKQAVLDTSADLGLAFDGDADRCFVIDEGGSVVDPSALTALIAVAELAREPGGTILHNLITSRVVAEVVREHGGTPVRTRVGHSFIKAVMAQTGAVFGGEHSGHFYFRDFWRADSGMLAAMHTLAALGRTEPGTRLSDLVAAFRRTARSGEINRRVTDVAAVTETVSAGYRTRPGVSFDDLDGLTVSGPGWWFNLRPSNTESLLRLNVEAGDEATMTAIRDEVLSYLSAEDQAPSRSARTAAAPASGLAASPPDPAKGHP